MKILILGGTGRTGHYIVNEALNRGHSVNALVRYPEKLKVNSDRLVTSQGTPTNREDLKKAMKDCEVVLSALNISRKSDFPWSKLVSPPDLLSESMRNVVELARLFNIKRIIMITAGGVGDSNKYLPGWFRWIIHNSNIGITYKDHERQEQILK